MLDGPGVEFIGEINEHQKTQFWATRGRCCFLSTGQSRSTCP
jgi:hypothetical protein